MADIQTDQPSSSGEGARQRAGAASTGQAERPDRGRAGAGGTQGGAAAGAPGGVAEAAGRASQSVADATREAAERGRTALRETPESWRGAAEPFLSMQSELNHWFDDLWRQATGLGIVPSLRPSRPFAALSAAAMFGMPAVDLKETDEAY